MAFDFFKRLFCKKQDNHPEVPEKVEASVASSENKLFPATPQEYDKDLLELGNILCVAPDLISKSYRYAIVRVSLGCERETLINGLKVMQGGLTDAQYYEYARFVFSKYVSLQYKRDDKEFINDILETMGFLPNSCDGQGYDEIPGGNGDFGITATNPVPVNGIPMNKVYLSRLLTSDGLEIDWKRRGSRSVSNIEYPVDIYEITDSNGNKRPTIYISSYHPSTSNIPPKGYKFKS